MLEESALQNQGGKEPSTRRCLSSITPNENLPQQCFQLVEVRTPDSLSMICREETKLNVPMNIMSSNTGLLIDGLKSSGRRKSESDLGKFVLKCASAASPGNVIISPVG